MVSFDFNKMNEVLDYIVNEAADYADDKRVYK
jgi:hypothetical protein